MNDPRYETAPPDSVSREPMECFLAQGLLGPQDDLRVRRNSIQPGKINRRKANWLSTQEILLLIFNRDLF